MRKIPNLCGPRADGRYYATDPGTRKPVYFGTDEEAARGEYERWRQLFVARRERLGVDLPACKLVSIASLSKAYLTHCAAYYVKNGKRTSEYASIKDALACMAGVGKLEVSEFKPSKLKDVRGVMLAKGWARGYINKQVGRIRRMFRWAAEEELADAGVLLALESVRPLLKGRTAAREETPILPIDWQTVKATLRNLLPRPRSLVLLQWWSGMRAEEAVSLRPCDLDRTGTPWIYRVTPSSNKTDHLDRDRAILLGPKARAVLAPLIAAARRPDSWLFHSRGRGPHSTKRGHLTVSGYRQAIETACQGAGLPHWFPLQLRHAALTRIRAAYGLEAAAAIGGHSEVETTQIYAERNLELARQVAEELG